MKKIVIGLSAWVVFLGMWVYMLLHLNLTGTIITMAVIAILGALNEKLQNSFGNRN